jgi:hypothetical protein
MNSNSPNHTFTTAQAVLRLVVATTAVALVGCTDPATEAPLPPLGAAVSETSVSGISSGAYMAGQYQLAHAADVVGAAIIAGGPWGCAESAFSGLFPGLSGGLLNVNKAINGCMLNQMSAFGVPNSAQLADKARSAARSGKIGPIEAVASDKIYLFTGTEDRTVKPPVVHSAKRFYENLGVPPSNILFEETLPAGHAFITDDQGASCGKTGEPYVNDCDYDQAGALLKHIYGPLNPRAATPTGTLVAFDQRPYTEKLGSHGLSGTGLIYIPKSCKTTKGCRIHIAFHGCAQNRATVGDIFADESGFARWADTNNMIVLYPQTATLPRNPQACWDWWGYTGDDFLSRDAKQLVAVKRMVTQLSQ